MDDSQTKKQKQQSLEGESFLEILERKQVL